MTISTTHHPAADTAFVSRLSIGEKGGLTVAVKDCIDIAGFPTRCGSAVFADAPPASANAVIVDRLLDAGCRIVGKTRLHEIAYGMTGVNSFEGTPLNVRWPDRIPGGSSSGSAVAVAANAVDFAIGTDTGGSIRQPAICCGVIGLKPTFGLVDRTGASPAQSSLDCIGPFATSMAMIERAMTALVPDYERVELAEAPKLGRLRLDAHVEPEMAEGLLALKDAEGRPLVDYDLPLLDEALKAGMTLISAETLAAHRQRLEEGAPFGEDIRKRLENARAISQADIDEAEQIRSRFSDKVDGLLADFDAIITPALPSRTPLLAEAGDAARVLPLSRYLRPFNLSGHPAIVLPTVTTTGLPSGVQIIGRKGEDARLCAIARWICETNPIFQVKD